MTYDELLLKAVTSGDTSTSNAIRAVVELHKPVTHKGYEETGLFCDNCDFDYPCPTIQVIEDKLN